MGTNKELDQLLRQSMKERYIIPDELDRKTYTRMCKIRKTKSFQFIRTLIIVNLLLTGSVFIFLWQFNADFILKLILSAIFLSFVSLLFTLYIMNYQLNNKKEIML